MNQNTSAQLQLIRELRDALSANAISWWLFGGWAVDFHVGEVTRDHGDIEIFIRAEAADAVREALVSVGFVAMPALYPDEGQAFVKDGQELGVWFLLGDEQGALHTPGRWADWPWAAGSFVGSSVIFRDIDAFVMSVDGLLDLKQNFHAHRYGAPLRDKDIADIGLLQRIVAERKSKRTSS